MEGNEHLRYIQCKQGNTGRRISELSFNLKKYKELETAIEQFD